MDSDIDIAHSIRLKDIGGVAQELGLSPDDLLFFGADKAKISAKKLKQLRDAPDGRLVLVTAMSPTAAGEGKTTLTIGLTQALSALGHKATLCVREPSLGPVFGMKGGAAGGGYSQVLPMEDINLQFTGDIPAVTAAHNLLSALIDNHIFRGNKLNINPNKVLWRRVVDMNDRSLRRIFIGIGDSSGVAREDGFDITASSEVMAILCLASDYSDLKKRLGDILVAYTFFGEPVYARQLGAEGAMCALLRQAFNPNLVQTIEHVPAFVHGGPFANIAHGCSSLIATKLALKLADIVVTEAGFGAELGAEKFFDIKCRMGGLKPSACVLVATIRALRHHGGAKDIKKTSIEAVKRGFSNLEKQIGNVLSFGVPLVVAINSFENDSPKEVEWVKNMCEQRGVSCETTSVYGRGAAGGEELANAVLEAIESENSFRFLYDLDESVEDKIIRIAKTLYGAAGVDFTEKAKADIRVIGEKKQSHLPVCISKTQKSLSDDPSLLGSPKNFRLTVTGLKLQSGAGFIVVYTGKIITMPGLPARPAAESIDVDGEGVIHGLF